MTLTSTKTTYTVKPASQQLFCQPDEAETTTSSGILLTAKAADKPKTAKVINVGSKVTEFSQADTIIYKTYATTDIKLNGEEFFLIDEQDVLGRLVEVDA